MRILLQSCVDRLCGFCLPNVIHWGVFEAEKARETQPSMSTRNHV